MTTLIIADHDNLRASEATFRLATAARQLGGPVTCLVAGFECADVAAQCARIDGIGEVLLADAPHLNRQRAEPMADLVLSLANDYDAIAAASGSEGKNVLPRIAALLDVMQISDAIAVKSPSIFVRPTYAGSMLETVRSRDGRLVLTFRTSAFPPAAAGVDPVPVTVVETRIDRGQSALIGEERSTSDRPELASARTVVSGGRAFGSKEKFDAYLVPLAERLGAAIGASRVAVDSGYAQSHLQVGQTGKVVAPDLYIACGISGAVQHLAGIAGARCIVAVNNDAEAPIFKSADYGIVGDIFDILPELTRKL